MTNPIYKVGDTVFYINQVGVILESNTFEHFREKDIDLITKGVPSHGRIINYITKKSGTEMSSNTNTMCWGYSSIQNLKNNSYYKVLIGNKKIIVHESELE